MAKRTIRLTEDELKTVVTESITKVLTEIGYRGVALAHGANYNAMQSRIQRNDINSDSKMDSANTVRLQAITHSINSNYPDLTLHFIERDKANQFYTVVLHFQEMKQCNDERFVMLGNMSISSQPFKQGYIEYNFKRQQFYRVNFYGSGSVRRIYPLIIDNIYQDTVRDVLTFITNICYSEKECENYVDINGSTPSKEH